MDKEFTFQGGEVMDEIEEAMEKYKGLVPLVYDIETMDLDKARTQDMPYAVYLKREADKVIDELKAQKAQAEDDCAYWKMREGNAVNAMHETEEACMFLTKSERRQKYKRCLAMAKMCSERFHHYVALSSFSPNKGAIPFYDKMHHKAYRWKYRWLELAEKFKEAL